MPDLRYKRTTNLNRPSFSTYNIEKDPGAGFKVKLGWNFEDSKIIGFRIYRAVYPKSLLNREYVISQRALEKLTPTLSNRWKNNILYNKSFFAKNSKVSFGSEKESRHDEPDSKASFNRLNYKYWSFIRTDVSGDGNYSYVDNSVKFGKTYAYLIPGVTRKREETSLGMPLIVNVEDVTPPSDVADFQLGLSQDSILVNLSIRDSYETAGYMILRRRVGDKYFKTIAENPSDRGEISFVDTDVIPGNEYEYRAYFFDYYRNISWSSPTKRIEYLSDFLKKGAVIDPIVQIKWEDPSVKITGQKNNDRILGYRIEKQDISNRDKKFSFGAYRNEIPWPNVFLFDEDGKIEINDFRLDPDSVYKYRISSISLTGKVESIFITPPFKPTEADFKSTILREEVVEPKILDFDIDILNVKQDPSYVKFMWQVEGDWDFVIIRLNQSYIKVDSIHDHIYFSKLPKGKPQTIVMEVYNLKGELAGKTRPSIITI